MTGQVAHQLLAEGAFGVLQSQPYMRRVKGHRLKLQTAMKYGIQAPAWLQDQVVKSMPAVVIRTVQGGWPMDHAIIKAAADKGSFFDAAPPDVKMSRQLSARVQKLLRSDPQALIAVQLALAK